MKQPKDKKAKGNNLQQQVAELTDKWKRAVADYRNLEMRMVREKEEWVKFGNRALLLQFLEILDDLERAKDHVEDGGLELIVDKFRQLLTEQGVEEMETKGQFNPELMECTELVAGKKEQIMMVEQKGYLYHGKLLRPAKVKVGNGQ